MDLYLQMEISENCLFGTDTPLSAAFNLELKASHTVIQAKLKNSSWWGIEGDLARILGHKAGLRSSSTDGRQIQDLAGKL